MQRHDLIFSNKLKYRVLRHAIFWFTWWMYFVALYGYNQKVGGLGKDNFIQLGSMLYLKSFLLLSIHAIGAYAFIFWLFPAYIIQTRKRLHFTVGIILMIVFLMAGGYVMYNYIFKIIDAAFGYPRLQLDLPPLWIGLSIGLLNAPKVVGTAVAIKLMKYWWLKKKEQEILEREKIATELQLLKAQVRPEFLFNALNTIYAYSLAGSQKASNMLLKLSEILSYVLYDCDEDFVPLEKEITMMEDYIALEKIRLNDHLDIGFVLTGEPVDKTIAPFILLPILETSFKCCSDMPYRAWMNIEVSIDENIFTFKLVNGSLNELLAPHEFYAIGLQNLQKRLNILYPAKFELSYYLEQEMFVVVLKIQLTKRTAIAKTTNSITMKI